MAKIHLCVKVIRLHVWYIAGWDRMLEDFDYTDVEMANLFHTIMNTTSFEGVSVSHKYLLFMSL